MIPAGTFNPFQLMLEEEHVRKAIEATCINAVSFSLEGIAIHVERLKLEIERLKLELAQLIDQAEDFSLATGEKTPRFLTLRIKGKRVEIEAQEWEREMCEYALEVGQRVIQAEALRIAAIDESDPIDQKYFKEGMR